MSIEKSIVELLINNDCVIIPEFGGFVANYKEAQINFSKQEISPPTRVVAFNSELNTNDGLLINYLASNNSISYKDATDLLNVFVLQTKKALSEGKELEFNGLGAFNSEKGRIIFTPKTNSNLYLETYGLDSFNYPLLKDNTAKIISVDKQINKEISKPKTLNKTRNKPKVKKNNRRLWLTVPAAAVVIALVVFTIITDNKYVNMAVEYASFNWFTNTEDLRNIDIEDINTQNEVILTEDEVLEVYPENIDNSSEKLTEETIIEEPETIIEEILEHPIEIEPVTNVNYIVVAGSFSVQNNAKMLCDSLVEEGFNNSRIIEANNGMYRVSIDGFETKQAAINNIASLKNQSSNNSLWISAF